MVNHPEELNPTEQEIQDFLEKNKAHIPPDVFPWVKEVLIKTQIEKLPVKEVIGSSPQLTEDLYQYGYSLFQSGKYEEALTVFYLLRWMDGSDERYSFAIAATYHYLNKYLEAIGNYMLCTLLNPENLLPYYHMSDCWVKLNQPELAFNVMNTAYQLAAKNSKYFHAKEKIELELEHLKSVMSSSEQKQESSAA